MATMQPQRFKAMVLVSATPYFPTQARPIMRQYPNSLPEQQWKILRRSHPGGDEYRDPFCPVELSVEMARAIPQSSLWILPDRGHGPVIGERWPVFLKTAVTFLTAPVNAPAT
jgi:hypothetical protein